MTLLPLTSGLRAANSHNAQAWRRRQTPDGMAKLPDLSRALPVADSGLHHLFASLACAAENLMLAAVEAGRSATLAFDGAGPCAGNVQGACCRPDFNPDCTSYRW